MVIVIDGKTYITNEATEIQVLRDVIEEHCGRDALFLLNNILESRVQYAEEQMEAAMEKINEYERIADGWMGLYRETKEEIEGLMETCLKDKKAKTYNNLAYLVRTMNSNL